MRYSKLISSKLTSSLEKQINNGGTKRDRKVTELKEFS